jgi:hypothetical protein
MYVIFCMLLDGWIEDRVIDQRKLPKLILSIDNVGNKFCTPYVT